MSWRLLVVLFVVACDDSHRLEDFYPPLPPPTGEAQGAFAGAVTEASQLVTGPAQTGLVGDFFLKNDRVTFIVQAPARVIGVIPQGGNVVDVALTDGATQLTSDHFGELGLIYLLGRTCEPDRVEIVRDGSGGGVAVLRAIGKSGNDDFLNLKGIGVFPVNAMVDPTIDDGVQCATTYVLAPGQTKLEVHHTLFNPTSDSVDGPLGTLADTGGNTEAWTNTRGFERADISAIGSLGQPMPSDYVVYQAPGVAYGLIPHHDTPVPHTQALIAGVSLFLDGVSSPLELLEKEKYFLHLKPDAGLTQSYDLVVGHDASEIDAAWRTGKGETLQPISGRVTFAGGAPAAGARVGIFVDGNGNGMLDDLDSNTDGTIDDSALSYLDVQPDGSFTGKVAATENLMVRAEVKNVGRSPAMPFAASLSLTVPAPIKVDYQILDADTSLPIPGRLIAIGDHLAFPDKRMFEVYDRTAGVVDSVHAIRGTTVDMGDGVDPALSLPAGGTYRVYASRGTEWSIASAAVTASGTYTFRLKHVVPTANYLATDWHVHQVGSPDSPVLSDERIKSAVSVGLEMFAVTDHDYVADLQPLVVQMKLDRLLRVLPGIEVTPFAYGHFNSWPLEPDTSSANHGAIDWARGAALGFDMLPGEIYDAMRARGAQMVQVNHPRSSGFGEFQAAFSRANVKYDFTNRTIFGDFENAGTPNDWLRLPEESLWSDRFNGLEVWNGFTMADSNGDMLRENKSLDRVMRDWLSMLSLGFFVTPAGDSDTHTSNSDPMGMPRTYLRVPDDSATALADGSAIDRVLATQTGANNTPRDVVVTNGPMIDVRFNNLPALGSVVPAVNQSVTLDVTVTAADWAEFDTLEIFANSTPDPVGSNDNTVLVPLKCYTSRTIATLHAMDPCAQAPMMAEPLNVQLVNIPGTGNYRRYEAQISITLDALDITTRAGATGKDAWLVFRVRGDRGIFPLLIKGDTVSTSTLPALLSGDGAAIRTALTGHGVPAAAFTSPVFVDFDGGGYRAPFAP